MICGKRATVRRHSPRLIAPMGGLSEVALERTFPGAQMDESRTLTRCRRADTNWP